MSVMFYVNLILFGLWSVIGYTQDKPSPSPHETEINELNFKYSQNIEQSPRIGLEYAKEAYDHYGDSLSPFLKFKIASNYATALYINEDFSKAIEILDRIKSQELNDKNKALYYTLKGLIQVDLNHPDKAEYNYKEALALYTKLKDLSNKFTVLNNLGLLYNNIGAYKKSLDAYLQCYEVMRKLGDEVSGYKYFMNIGTVTANLKDFNTALTSYKKALNEAESHRQMLGVIQIYDRIGAVYYEQDSLQKSLFYTLKAVKGFKKFGRETGRASTYLRLGDLYTEMKKKDSALTYFAKTYEIAKKNQYAQILGESSFRLGKYYQNTGDLSKANFYYNYICDHKRSINNKNLLQNTYYRLYEIANGKKDDEKALKYLREYLKLNIKIQQAEEVSREEQIKAQYSLKRLRENQENLEATNKLKTLKLENKKQQFRGLIVLFILILVVLILIFVLYKRNKSAKEVLKSQNEKINVQYDKLKRSNEEIEEQRKQLSQLNEIKDRLISIIAHDVKSPVTNLYGFLSVIRSRMEEIKKEELYKSLTELEADVSNLLHFLNNVLNWVMSQSSGIKVQIEEVELNKLIENNLKLLESAIFNKEITVVFNKNPEINTINTDFDIVDLTIRNLLSNAVKYTYSGGKIEIKVFSNQKGRVAIAFADTGIGLDKETRDLLNREVGRVPSKLGVNREEGYGIGLSLCIEMLKKIDAEIVYKENEPIGSIFTLKLNTEYKHETL